MYVGLWSRIAGFHRDTLTRALERHTVVQGTLLAITIHLVSARDYWPLVVAVRDSRRTMWLQAHRGRESSRSMKAAAKRLGPQLADGPLTRAEVAEAAGNAERTNGVNPWIDLVRVPLSGTWDRRRADLYQKADDVLGAPSVDATLLVHARATGVIDEERRPLVFNPKTPQSVATFTVDGRVAGTRREEKGKVTLEAWEPVPRRFRKELDDEKAQLEAFVS